MKSTFAIDADLAIADLFVTLGVALQEPDFDLVDRLRLMAASADALPDSLAGDVRALAQTAESMGLDALRDAFVAQFGHVAMSDAPAYETMYGSSEIFAQTAILADVAAFYRAFGVEPAEARHEPPDHVSVEMEFVGLLVLRAAIAPSEEARDTTVSACRTFLSEHLGRWAPLFFRRLRRKSGFLADAALLAERLVLLQCARVGATPVPLPDLPHPPVACDPGDVDCEPQPTDLA
ncbi:MAG: molecular chaperone TorD family protein [Planctomycetes bacterium]|nr:molecular chaperone TorD family protein [Planctomycetota bacterium]MBI3843304.1 molecular chaperone TorD family protein [Planctomycetota bacterium]